MLFKVKCDLYVLFKQNNTKYVSFTPTLARQRVIREESELFIETSKETVTGKFCRSNSDYISNYNEVKHVLESVTSWELIEYKYHGP